MAAVTGGARKRALPSWWPRESEEMRWQRAGGRERAEALAAWTPWRPPEPDEKPEPAEEDPWRPS